MHLHPEEIEIETNGTDAQKTYLLLDLIRQGPDSFPNCPGKITFILVIFDNEGFRTSCHLCD